MTADARPPSPAERDADCLIAELYAREYRSLTRLAVLLVFDVQTAEEIVGDALAATCRGWRRSLDSGQALPYLRRAVVSKSRSARHGMVAIGNEPKAQPGRHSAAGLERSPVVAAVRELPRGQREAIVLRYYAGLAEAEVAAAMGVRRGKVKGYIARALSSLSVVLERDVRIR